MIFFLSAAFAGDEVTPEDIAASCPASDMSEVCKTARVAARAVVADRLAHASTIAVPPPAAPVAAQAPVAAIQVATEPKVVYVTVPSVSQEVEMHAGLCSAVLEYGAVSKVPGRIVLANIADPQAMGQAGRDQAATARSYAYAVTIPGCTLTQRLNGVPKGISVYADQRVVEGLNPSYDAAGEPHVSAILPGLTSTFTLPMVRDVNGKVHVRLSRFQRYSDEDSGTDDVFQGAGAIDFWLSPTESVLHFLPGDKGWK